jgi:hypothetical protein
MPHCPMMTTAARAAALTTLKHWPAVLARSKTAHRFHGDTRRSGRLFAAVKRDGTGLLFVAPWRPTSATGGRRYDGETVALAGAFGSDQSARSWADDCAGGRPWPFRSAPPARYLVFALAGLRSWRLGAFPRLAFSRSGVPFKASYALRTARCEASRVTGGECG